MKSEPIHLEQYESFWQRYLKGILAPTPLRMEQMQRTLSGGETGEHGEQDITLTTDLTTALLNQADQHQFSVHTLFAGAWTVLLSRYSGERDILFGSTGENDSTLLPIRAQVEPDADWLTLVQQIKHTSLTLEEAAGCSLEQIRAWSEIPSDCPLFTSLLIVQHEGTEAGHEVDADLPLHIVVSLGAEWKINIKYDATKYPDLIIERMLGHFQTLLEGISQHGSMLIGELPWLTEAESRQLLVEWNQTAAEYPSDTCIHRLFEQQAAKTPEAIALVCGTETLTYREVNERAEIVASHLQKIGVGEDVIVGVCMERSPEMIIGLLATLKAGGAYLPLDPEYPQERLTYMLEDSQAHVLLTQERLLGRLPDVCPRVIALDKQWESLAMESTIAVTDRATAHSLAYVIYTSGSTGKPKGTLIEHRGVCNLIHDLTDRLALHVGKRMLQFASFSFDASVWEIFSTLCSGATLCLAHKDELVPGEPLAELLQREQITTMMMPPSGLALLPLVDLPHLELIASGGEACSAELVARWAPHRRFVNFYGPTEATVCVTAAELVEFDRKPTIGHILPNTELYVLDEQLQPVPVGVPGELHIGGVGLARGYLNRPEITAEKFIPHPFSTDPDARVYKTGDLVRYLPDGSLDYIGRIDDQVKLRGFRIELGEIEERLLQHPQVREVVVIVREDMPGDKRLVAYALPEEGAQVGSRDLRAFLQGQLPAFMMPSAFVVLAELPLTPNGKLDRRALPAPELTRMELTTDYVAPSNECEVTLAGIWAELLGVEPVGAWDNFLELGGHSLLAAQVIARVRETLRVDVSVRDLLDGGTIAKLAETIAQRQASHGSMVEAVTSIPKLHKSQARLSFAQGRMWFLDQMSPGSSSYNTPYFVRVQGELDVDRVRVGLQAIVNRHDVLRTTFQTMDGQPVQVIAPEMTLHVPFVDLSGLEQTEREETAKQLMVTEARLGFDLSEGPLVRCSVLRVAEDEHLLLLNMHHIVSDGWSMGVLLRELSALYASEAEAGQLPALTPLSIQYADFAEWQHEQEQLASIEEQVGYWKQQLAGVQTLLELPTDRPRPAVLSDRGAVHFFEIPEQLIKRLKKWSLGEGATLFMLLLASYQTLLYRYTRQEDILVGSPSAGREKCEVEGLIGFFVNTLIYRANFANTPTFRELLQQIRERAMGAYAHAGVPFEKLVDELEVERHLSYTPLIQTIFTLESTAPAASWSVPGTQMSEEPVDNGTAKFDIALRVVENGQRVTAEWNYNTDLFDSATMERMAEHWLLLLEGIALQPDLPLADLTLLSVEEKRQVLVDWNRTERTYPMNTTVHQLIEAQVERTPDVVAVEYQDAQLTYRELNERANQLAHHLRGLGVGSDVLVGISVERSLEMIIGMLGVLKAGGAYVPLDPNYPQERLQYILADAQVTILLTQATLRDSLSGHGAQVVCLDVDWDVIAEESRENPVYEATSRDLAYVIYTSGSTGQPKGTLLEHRGLCNLVFAVNEQFAIGVESRVLQFATFNFDASVYETFTTLVAGGTLCLADQDDLLPGTDLHRFLRDKEISTAMLPPSALAVTSADELPDLQLVVSGGEACSAELVARWSAGRRFINAYGPTEGTVCVTLAECDSKMIKPTIGRPIGNVKLYVLDQHLHPVPIGVPGELHIASVGLARGYLHRPDLTAEKFIPNRFSDDPEARLYKTGDLVRWLPDGQLDYLGRIDEQVKIRGFRIELGEVEEGLLAHVDVREAVVLARDDAPGGKRLAAYVVREAGTTVTGSDLRTFLKDKMPSYMIPSAFVFLDALPLTANGKVNRRALPTPDWKTVEVEGYQAPRTEIEQRVASIWGEVLGAELVSVHHNFFDLGGHSLLATQVVSRVRQTLQAEVSVRDLFGDPTLEGFAAVVEGALTGLAVLEDEGISLLPDRVTGESFVAPLSFSQQRLWFLHQMEQGTGSYSIPYLIRLQGSLDVAALQRGLSDVIQRHETLRTTFTTVKGQPMQRIAPELQVTIPFVDLQALSETERALEVDRVAAEEATQPFDLEQGPLVRAKVLCTAQDEYVLLLNTHHIISDGWSMNIFLRELAACYEANLMGGEANLPTLRIQYADYAQWQRDHLQGETFEQLLSYWKGQLAGATNLLELPTDHQRPAVQSGKGAYHAFTMPKELTEALKKVSRQEDATLFVTLLAAFQTLLQRYSRQEEILVGFPSAGRNRTETEGLIGFFVNTLVCRTDFTAVESFRDLVRQVRETVVGAYAHEDLPFERLVDELGLPRSLSHNPLIQTMFLLETSTVDAKWQLPNLQTSLQEIDNGTTMFDLTLHLTDGEEGLTGGWQYSTDLFDARTMERLTGHWLTLLEAICNDPAQPLMSLPLLTEGERYTLLEEWTGQTGAQSLDTRVQDLLQEQAERTPDAVAVVWGEQTLTYRQLNECSNQLAHKLQRLGVGPDVLVGICVERNLDMVVGLLGILKSGAAYVPLDPEYPADRVAFMLADAQAPVLLTQERLLATLPDHQGHVICLDRDWQEIEEESTETPQSATTADHLAYVIYTSGSTGLPKGVALEHRSVVAFIQWAKEVYTPEELAVVLFSTSMCFDISVFEVFVTLSMGGRLVIAENALQLPTLPAADEITLINTVPSAMAELLRMGAIPPSVRTVNLGGEALKHVIVEQLYAIKTVEKVYNLYGPTEDTVYSVFELTDPAKSVLIGKTLTDTQAYVLDSLLQPVPIGVPGELHLGGVGLARGYLHRPELTEEKFISNPFSAEIGSRLYKTGDLVRYLPDGTLEYLGRIDHQVKIRGFRIEIGEIEDVLIRHHAVREVVIVASDDKHGNKRLVAYLSVQEEEATTTTLRNYLREHLPEYMVPALFVFLDRLPLTPNGKVDRKALPLPDLDHLQLENVYVSPRTELERELATVWGELLGVQQVGIHDNFFELGGHSLLATQVVSRVRDSLAVELSVRHLFETPTVAELSEKIEGMREMVAGGKGAGQAQITQVSRAGTLPLSFAQQRLWFMNQLHPDSPMYNLPLILRLNGELDVTALEQSLSEIVRRHEALRTTFDSVDEQAVQIIGEAKQVRVSLIDLARLPQVEREEEAKRLLDEAVHRPFDLTNGPLLRSMLIKHSETEYDLLVLMHHIVSDGWSMGVLMSELAALYEQFAAGKQPELPSLSVQYADYAHWQREWLQGDVLAKKLDYWQEHLGGELPVLNLPTDHPRPPVMTFNGAYQEFELTSELTRQLNELSQRTGTSLFMTLLAAYKMLLHRYSNQDDIVVGTPIANRQQGEIEGLIGFFVNMLALRTDFTDVSSFRDLMKRVRAVTLAAYEHQDVPFEQLVDRLQIERDPSRTPLFQAVMILQNTPTQTWQVPGLTMEAQPIDGNTSKFDITFSMEEKDGVLAGVVEYNTDLFDRSTITRMIGHWQNLLQSIAEDADRPLSQLSLISAEEREQLLVTWNETSVHYPDDRTINQLFEEQVERSPDALAVIDGEATLTYRELNKRANQVAHRLRELGVGGDALVGISVERSLHMLVGIVGILKAGGAYVPLDPEYPQDRLTLMIEDAQLNVVLTQEHLAKDLPVTDGTLLCLDSEWETEFAGQPADNLPCLATAQSLAYVIYTSGSTGRPKGVCVPQYAVNRLVHNTNYVQFTADDRFAQISNASFDAATFELWGALLHGAQLVIIPKHVVLNAEEFAEVLEQAGITKMFITVALFNQMASTVPHAFRTMHDLLTGGDAVDPKSVQAVLESGPPKRLLNGYGPTECTTFAVYHEITHVREGHSIPIGRPLQNTTAYVLDRHLSPVPIGVVGELYLGGAGLAHGYLNRPDLTEERFIPHPFSADPDARLYKTGDLVRYLPDGTIEFIGRTDHQVKIRGFRIELGEIEQVLTRHPAVRNALVLVREDDPGDKRLVAYVTLNEGITRTGNELRNELKETLPAYMMPSAIVVLDEFPLTPNGKIDRRALPQPETVRVSHVTKPTQAASTDGLSSQLIAIWQGVLGVDQIGVNDNFFDLGGHSLLLTKVHGQIQELLGRKFSLMDMFKHTTIQSLVNFLDPNAQAASKKKEKKRVESLPCSTESTNANSNSIAIIGMTGRFPDANDLTTFWQNLVSGVESVQFFPESNHGPDLPGIVKAGALLKNPEYFDAEFFGLSETEALLTDPQQRLMLECVWEALEGAGYEPKRYDGKIAFYAASSENTYSQLIFANPEILQDPGHLMFAAMGNDPNFMASRISYWLNLKGPSFVVQTACSSSAVSIHLACQSLLAGENDMALAGGVNVKAPQQQGYFAFEGGPYSFDGKNCKPFDATTQGAFQGYAAGVLLLKRLDDALADGDTIHAVIRATEINNDGAEKVGYSALGLDGIERVVSGAIEKSGIEPETVTAIAAHGMGTPFGDAIEVEALTRAYGAYTEQTGYAAVHSVKPNIGHVGVAAGVVNVIHTVLAMKHQTLLPTLHFSEPNPQIDFASSPFYVNTAPKAWETIEGTPRRAGVNSFGMGGTNAHLILEEAPMRPASEHREAWHLLILSARTESALCKQVENLAAWLDGHRDVDLADVAYTLQLGRATFAHRLMLVVHDHDDAIEQLRALQESPFEKGGSGASATDLTNEVECLLTQLTEGADTDREGLLTRLGGLWQNGAEIDWTALYEEQTRRRIQLPTYPFERKRLSVEPLHTEITNK